MTQTRKSQAGFTLVELVITIAIIIILTAIALIGGPAVINGVNENRIKAKMSAIGAAANTFRTTMGQKRYPTLQELATRQPGQTSALVPDLVITGTPPQAEYAGYVITSGGIAPTDKTFTVYATKGGASPSLTNRSFYIVFEDGVLRRTTTGSVSERTAPPVK